MYTRKQHFFVHFPSDFSVDLDEIKCAAVPVVKAHASLFLSD